jgi:hypothetical protein
MEKKWGILHRRVSLFRRIFCVPPLKRTKKKERRGTQFLSSGNMASRWGRRHWQDQDDVWQSHTHTLRGGGQIITTHNMRVCLHIQRADAPRQREIRSEPPQFTGGGTEAAGSSRRSARQTSPPTSGLLLTTVSRLFTNRFSPNLLCSMLYHLCNVTDKFQLLSIILRNDFEFFPRTPCAKWLSTDVRSSLNRRISTVYRPIFTKLVLFDASSSL